MQENSVRQLYSRMLLLEWYSFIYLSEKTTKNEHYITIILLSIKHRHTNPRMLYTCFN